MPVKMTFNKGKVPVKVFTRDIDHQTIQQLGSMGAKSFIVRGKGSEESLCSCSHGAGRVMSRTQAKHTYTVDDMVGQTQGIECRKDSGVIDEIPSAYKDIDTVMENQNDLVEVVHTLKQSICIKG